MQNALFLHEEILLLALRDEEGTIASGTMYQYAGGYYGGLYSADSYVCDYGPLKRVD